MHETHKYHALKCPKCQSWGKGAITTYGTQPYSAKGNIVSLESGVSISFIIRYHHCTACNFRWKTKQDA